MTTKESIKLDNGGVLICDPEMRILCYKNGGVSCGAWRSANYDKSSIVRNLPLPAWCVEQINETNYLLIEDIIPKSNKYNGFIYGAVVRGRIMPVRTEYSTRTVEDFDYSKQAYIEEIVTYKHAICADCEINKSEVSRVEGRVLWSVPTMFQRSYLEQKYKRSIISTRKEMYHDKESHTIVKNADGVEVVRTMYENRERTINEVRVPIIQKMSGNDYSLHHIADRMYLLYGWKNEIDKSDCCVNWEDKMEVVLEKTYLKRSETIRCSQRAGESNDGFRMEYDYWTYYYEYYDVLVEGGNRYIATKRVDVENVTC